MASPMSAGAAALLISAAQQYGAQHQPAQIRQALNSSARFLSGRYQVYEQGNGLINVGAAWDLLKTNIKTVAISSDVPVNTLLSGFLAKPGVGVGINGREGVVVGSSYTRTYTFNRTNGKGGTITYNLLWVDNDGTFQLSRLDRPAQECASHVGCDDQPGNKWSTLGHPKSGRSQLGWH